MSFEKIPEDGSKDFSRKPQYKKLSIDGVFIFPSLIPRLHSKKSLKMEVRILVESLSTKSYQ